MKILSWSLGRKPAQPQPAPPQEKHYGLFTVSVGDVLISRPLYEVIVQHLEAGTPDARQELARQLRELVQGMY